MEQLKEKHKRWANSVLKDYILRGYAVNDKRIDQLGQLVQVMKRVEYQLDTQQVLSVIESYSVALDLLDDYDHQTLSKPKGNEKDDSFKGSIGAIYQSFGGNDLYPSLEEKAANLLYFVTKNHSFSDGNKRIAATMFLYFLDKNGALFIDGFKRITDYTLAALTIMVAESKPEEKEVMVNVIMNCQQYFPSYNCYDWERGLYFYKTAGTPCDVRFFTGKDRQP